jgi:hypothetical protein
MENALFQQWDALDDYNEDYTELIDVLNSKDSFRSFGEGVLCFLRKNNPKLTDETASKYISQLCERNSVETSDIGSRNKFKDWFFGDKRPKKCEDSRKAIFALAFALELNPSETAELFHKVYLDRAFDYRNANEIIYYFCLNNKKSWADAKRLIELENDFNSERTDHTVYTSQMKADVDSFTNENELLLYLKNHAHNLEKRNVSAKINLSKLIELAKKTANEEAKQLEYAEIFRGSDRDSLNFTYEVITSLSVSGDKGTKTLFKNARLPKEIKNRFPEAVTLSKKEPTYEELRKLIIMLFSYTYWYKVQWTSVDADIDDYIAQINVYLIDSGFSPMYYGNPFDWMFLYCALNERPLDIFRGLLAEVLGEE